MVAAGCHRHRAAMVHDMHLSSRHEEAAQTVQKQRVTSHQIALMGFAALHVAQLQSNCSSNLDASEVCIRMCHILQWPRNSACNLQALPGSRFLNGSHSHAHCGASFMHTLTRNLPKQSRVSLTCHKARGDAKCLPGFGKHGRHEAGTYMEDTTRSCCDKLLQLPAASVPPHSQAQQQAKPAPRWEGMQSTERDGCRTTDAWHEIR